MTHQVMLIFAQFLAAFSEKYSHYQHYTVLSKPVMTPGIYDFSYMGLINDTEIESYNSENRTKIPEQDWMRENMTEDYWKKGTDKLRDEELWMRYEFNKMMTAMGHSLSDVHILQRRRGCEVERLSDGSVKFLSGSEQYRYDGQDFLSFNLHTEQWEDLTDQALRIKERWNRNIPFKYDTLEYIKKTCVDWAEKLMKCEDDYIRSHSPPDVYIFSKKCSTPDMLNLTCLATGFLPEEIAMEIKRNNSQMHEKLESTGVRPNGDRSHQLRMSVEIPESDRAEYHCSVIHRVLETPIVKIWDGKSSDCNTQTGIGIDGRSIDRIDRRNGTCKNCDGDRALGGVIGGVIVVVLILLVIFVLYKRGLIGSSRQRDINVQPRTFAQSGGVSVVTMGSPPGGSNGHAAVRYHSNGANGTSNGVGNGVNGHNGTQDALLGN